MHPAPSVIIFTVFSGLGFGMLVFLGLGLPPVTGWTAFFFYLAAYAMAVGGLMASAFHLGNPQRALKAFTQWRTSWLSREAWVSVAALAVMGIHAFAAVFFGAILAPIGWLGAGLSVFAVYCTSMIYAQLKTVPRWNTWLTPLHLITLSFGGGAALMGHTSLAGLLIVLAAAIQVAHWQVGDRALARSGTTLASATGLGNRGRVTAFEPPHTGSNYLLKEMVYTVGRGHAAKLRLIALALGYGIPGVLLLLPLPGVWPSLIAVPSHIIGILAARWLFFAQAEHVVGLYYGKRAA